MEFLFTICLMSVFNWSCHHFAVNDQQVQLKKRPATSDKQRYGPNTPGPGLEVNIFSRGRRKKDMITISSLGSTIKGDTEISRKAKTSLNTMVTNFLIFSIRFNHLHYHHLELTPTCQVKLKVSSQVRLYFILDPITDVSNNWRIFTPGTLAV